MIYYMVQIKYLRQIVFAPVTCVYSADTALLQLLIRYNNSLTLNEELPCLTGLLQASQHLLRRLAGKFDRIDAYIVLLSLRVTAARQWTRSLTRRETSTSAAISASCCAQHACTLRLHVWCGASDFPVCIPEMQGRDCKRPKNSAQLNSSSNLRARGGQTLECLQARTSAEPQARTQASDLAVNMAKAKSVTPQSKPAVAAKKNVKAKQAAVKAETKKAAPKKACAQPALCTVFLPSCQLCCATPAYLCIVVQADTSSEEESSSDEEDTPVKANGAATPTTAKVCALLFHNLA